MFLIIYGTESPYVWSKHTNEIVSRHSAGTLDISDLCATSIDAQALKVLSAAETATAWQYLTPDTQLAAAEL